MTNVVLSDDVSVLSHDNETALVNEPFLAHNICTSNKDVTIEEGLQPESKSHSVLELGDNYLNRELSSKINKVSDKGVTTENGFQQPQSKSHSVSEFGDNYLNWELSSKLNTISDCNKNGDQIVELPLKPTISVKSLPHAMSWPQHDYNLNMAPLRRTLDPHFLIMRQSAYRSKKHRAVIMLRLCFCKIQQNVSIILIITFEIVTGIPSLIIDIYLYSKWAFSKYI